MRLAAVLVVVMLVGASTFASAQTKPFGPPESALPSSRHSDECADFHVESVVAVNRAGGVGEEGQLPVDFAVTVSVLNPCGTPLNVQYGSFLTYETNFPSLVGQSNQPVGCDGQRWTFSGPVPPHQNAAFTMNVRGCRFPVSETDRPRISVENGRVITDRGEKPVPSLARVMP